MVKNVLSKLLQTILVGMVRGMLVVLIGIVCAVGGTNDVFVCSAIGLVQKVAITWSAVSVSTGSGFGAI